MSGLNPTIFDQASSVLLPELEEHRLLRGRDFYTIPRELLEQIVDDIGEQNFEAESLEIERHLSALNGDHSRHIGFRHGTKIPYNLLANPRSYLVDLSNVSDEDRARIGVAPSWGRDQSNIRAADRRLAWNTNVCRGYAGWLILNSKFNREQQEFLIRWRDQISALGLVRTFGVQVPRMALAPITVARESFNAYAAARDRFLRRWQLVNLAGPFLPDPIRTSMPRLQSADDPQAWAMGSMLFLPAIFPLPDRKMLREMMEDTLHRNNSSAHLRKWLDLVSSESQGKKTITRNARIFMVQHFWRIVHSRHAQALEGRQAQIRRAFASYFFPNVSDTSRDAKAETIRKDLDAISKARGGPGWQYPLDLRKLRLRRSLGRKMID